MDDIADISQIKLKDYYDRAKELEMKDEREEVPLYNPSLYVQNFIKQNNRNIPDFPQLTQKDQQYYYFQHTHAKLKEDFFEVEEKKTKISKKKPRLVLKDCICCEQKVTRGHQCKHTQCQKPCPRMKKIVNDESKPKTKKNSPKNEDDHSFEDEEYNISSDSQAISKPSMLDEEQEEEFTPEDEEEEESEFVKSTVSKNKKGKPNKKKISKQKKEKPVIKKRKRRTKIQMERDKMLQQERKRKQQEERQRIKIQAQREKKIKEEMERIKIQQQERIKIQNQEKQAKIQHEQNAMDEENQSIEEEIVEPENQVKRQRGRRRGGRGRGRIVKKSTQAQGEYLPSNAKKKVDGRKGRKSRKSLTKVQSFNQSKEDEEAGGKTEKNVVTFQSNLVLPAFTVQEGRKSEEKSPKVRQVRKKIQDKDDSQESFENKISQSSEFKVDDNHSQSEQDNILNQQSWKLPKVVKNKKQRPKRKVFDKRPNQRGRGRRRGMRRKNIEIKKLQKKQQEIEKNEIYQQMKPENENEQIEEQQPKQEERREEKVEKNEIQDGRVNVEDLIGEYILSQIRDYPPAENEQFLKELEPKKMSDF